MMSFWRTARRWLQDHRERAIDLLVLVLVCALGAAVFFVLEPRPVILHELSSRIIGWLGLLVLGLAVYAWRRWCEISALLTEADTDVLTGLNNRRKTERLLLNEFDRAMRYKRPLSVIIIDIDHFKRVNDTFGHPVGDVVLATVARRIRRRMRVSDHFGRWGGEEFVLICPETPMREATLVADRMRRTIKHRVIGKVGYVTASFGVATYSRHRDYDALVDEADVQLYNAKHQGRDRVMNKEILAEQNRRLKEGKPLAEEKPGGTSLGSQLASMDFTVMSPLSRDKRRR
jgi:diguanylate cyclase (GGDEF)-like protein